MSFYANNNQIYIRNNDGDYVFDTENKMPAITQKISGSITISEKNPNDGYHSVVHNLGSIDANTEFLFVTCKLSTDNSWLNTYFNGTGSIITGYGVEAGDGWSKYISLHIITFRRNTSNLELYEEFYDGSRYYWDPSIGGFTVDYTCYLGRFK